MNRRTLLKLTAIPVVGALAGALFMSRARANAYYDGPVSDHFNGTHFFNPGGDEPRGFTDLLRWRFGETAASWPPEFTSPFKDTPPARVDADTMRVSFVGHASFLVQTAGLNILLDPVWAERASPVTFAGPRRINPPGIAFDDLPRIDAVIVSHNHYDHMDIPTLVRLWQRDRPRIITPLGNDAIIRADHPGLEVTTVDWGQQFDLPGGVRLHAETAQHWSARGLGDRRHALWASFVIAAPWGKVYFAGDTGFGDGRTFRQVAERHPDLRLGILPIGAYEPRWFMRAQHINPAEAVDVFKVLGLEAALGYHWGTFQLTNEPIDQPPKDLTLALDAAGIAPDRFTAVRPGQVWTAARNA